MTCSFLVENKFQIWCRLHFKLVVSSAYLYIGYYCNGIVVVGNTLLGINNAAKFWLQPLCLVVCYIYITVVLCHYWWLCCAEFCSIYLVQWSLFWSVEWISLITHWHRWFSSQLSLYFVVSAAVETAAVEEVMVSRTLPNVGSVLFFFSTVFCFYFGIATWQTSCIVAVWRFINSFFVVVRSTINKFYRAASDNTNGCVTYIKKNPLLVFRLPSLKEGDIFISLVRWNFNIYSGIHRYYSCNILCYILF